MADDALWIDEAAMQSMYQDGNQPSRDQEAQLYKQLTGEGIPLPRARPQRAEGDIAHGDRMSKWNKLSDEQKLKQRQSEIEEYNAIMQEYDAQQKRKGGR
jgi:hypothetical protein